MKPQPVALSASAGPSRAQPPTSSLKKNNATGIGGLPGGVVGPEAAGLDPSGPEHFFVTLAAYADALDALPLDLTRSFSDLRELDAVLGSHLNSLTARLNHLTALIEDPDVDQGQRLLALKEVAEEARAYKMGGEDKIRVALNTAETIISHTDYIEALDSQLDRFPEISALLNPTKHLKLEQYYVSGQLKDRKLVSSLENHTGVASGLAASDINGTGGTKKKKVAAHVAAGGASGGKSHKAAETASVPGTAAGAGGASSSKKRKAISGAAVAGSSASANAKVAKTSASGKADEDVKTAANGSNSHKKKTDGNSAAGSGSKANQSNSNTRLPRAAHAHSVYTEEDEEGPSGRKDATSRRGAAAAGDVDESSSASRSRNSRAVRAAAAPRSDDEEEDMDDGDAEDEGEATVRSSNTKSRGRAGRGAASNSRGRGAAAAAASPHTASNSASRADSPSSNAGGAGDDADEARYCFCNNVSYGDMIGCDDDDCEREWFHLGCVGLTKPPQGTWYCEACLERRAANGRGGKGKKAKSSGGSKSKVRR